MPKSCINTQGADTVMRLDWPSLTPERYAMQFFLYVADLSISCV